MQPCVEIDVYKGMHKTFFVTKDCNMHATCVQCACTMPTALMHHACSMGAPCIQHGCLHHIRNMRCYACSIHGTCTQHALTCLQHTCIMCLTCSKPRHRGLSGRRSAAELCMVSFQAVEYQSVRTPHLKPDKSMRWSHECSTYIALRLRVIVPECKAIQEIVAVHVYTLVLYCC